MIATIPERIEIMEVPITVFKSYDHASRCIVEGVRQRQRMSCVAINPVKVHAAWKDRQLSSMINAADFCLCDGIGVAIAARLLLGRTIHRITGIQLFFDLIACAETHGLKVFLLGAKPRSNRSAHENLKRLYPKLQVVGRNHGYFGDNDAVIEQINESGADMLFVAMGSPRQEKWLAQYRDRIDAHFCMGVGGSFDVLSGNVKRAPGLFRMTGTEWLYRLIAQPRRLGVQVVLPLFALSVVRQLLAGSPSRTLQVGAGRRLKTRENAVSGRVQGHRVRHPRTGTVGCDVQAGSTLSREAWIRSDGQPTLTES